MGSIRASGPFNVYSGRRNGAPVVATRGASVTIPLLYSGDVRRLRSQSRLSNVLSAELPCNHTLVPRRLGTLVDPLAAGSDRSPWAIAKRTNAWAMGERAPRSWA